VLAEWLPHLRAVLVDRIERTEAGVEVVARPAAPQAACPACGAWSSRVHSGYVRHVQAGPAGGQPVRIDLAVRRFFCGNPACRAATFAEQVDGLTVRLPASPR